MRKSNIFLYGKDGVWYEQNSNIDIYHSTGTGIISIGVSNNNREQYRNNDRWSSGLDSMHSVKLGIQDLDYNTN